MSNDDKSLSDQPTFSGSTQPQDKGPQSLGDEATFGDAAGGGEAVFDDGMEVIDLSARYTVEGVLGKGGMGEVLLATDTRLNRKVAIKRILGDAANSRTAVSRFLTEAQSIAALNHANIVQIYDYGRAADGPFLIMEFVEGRSLLDKCRDGALDLDEAVALTCQLCDGLGKAHDAGIIHRDIKPANVLLTNDGIPKLTDFGLAKDEAADSGLSMAGAVLGTLDFMPPEQRKDVALTDSRSDLWSLAATLYQMVTGQSPKIIRFNNVPQSLHDVLGKALEDQKDDRYQTAKEFRDALKAALQNAGEVQLEEGSCPSCGTKNPTNRKFCRNEDCGADLQVPCLSCSEKIPMWEGICDSCGAKQRDLLDDRRLQMSSQQSEAESLLKDYKFDKAIKLATALHDEPDLRLQHLKGWATKFQPLVEQVREQQLQRIGKLVDEAIVHDKAYDYSSGIHTLKQVPEALRSTEVANHSQTVGQFLSQLQRKQSTIQQLDKLIRERVKIRQLNGLQEQVDDLLQLCPDRKDIQELKEQLTQREAKLIQMRDESISTAKDLLEKQDYTGAIKALDQVDAYVQTEEVTRLSAEASEKHSHLEKLRKTIEKATSAKQLNGLLKKVDEYLSLKPDDADMQKLQARLEAREKKNAAQLESTVQKAYSLRDTCQFDKAIKALQRIPQELITDEASDLLTFCESASVERSEALEVLRRSQTSEDYGGALKASKEYSVLIREEMLDDEGFQQAVQACKRSLIEQQEEEEAERQRKAFQAKMAVGTGAVIAIALLIAAGMWIRSSMNASALADAVQQQQWNEALAIDSDHVPALIGRANQRLTAGTPDIEGAFADISLAEQVDSTVAELKPAKALAHAKRAASLATDGKITDAETDLKEAETLGASDSQLTPVRRLLAAAYVKQAEEGVTRGDVPGIRAACDAAERYQAADSDVNRLRAAAFKADGEQKAKSGDLSGAVAAFDDALKLNSSLGLKTERAVLHVKLGEQAVAKQDYAAAATELDSAVSLDKSATGVVALAGSVAEPVFIAFEEAPTVENQTAALAAISSIQAVDAQNEELPVLRNRVKAAALKRGESVAGQAPDSALQDYLTALSMGASASESATLKGELVKALTARCRQWLGSQDVAKASADYVSVAKLDSQAASLLETDFEKLPLSVMNELPASVLSQLPASVLSELPPRKNSIGMAFKLLPGGTFTMGEGDNAHRVTLTQPFELGVYEVTQQQYGELMGINPSKFAGGNHPVERVSWFEAVEFCKRLSALPAERSAGHFYRLPTEAEWEYACRAGTTTDHSFGDSESELGEYGWDVKNASGSTHPVGGKTPNTWGLYDMHGNVFEWCQDWHDDYPRGDVKDPTGPTSGSDKVYRGGSWVVGAWYSRSAHRMWIKPSADHSPGLGFRVALSPSGE